MLIIQWITINEIEEYDFDLYYDTNDKPKQKEKERKKKKKRLNILIF